MNVNNGVFLFLPTNKHVNCLSCMLVSVLMGYGFDNQGSIPRKDTFFILSTLAMSNHPSIQLILSAPSPRQPLVPRFGLCATVSLRPLISSWPGTFIMKKTLPATNF